MITAAELPINQHGAVYHLNLRPEELADTIITVGDPGRVAEVSQHFDNIEVKKSYREFVTHTGFLGKHRITVLSTGIGMPNIDIVMNELDALANIDFTSRTINTTKKKLTIIRIGTTGGLITACTPGDIVISRYAIGFDSLLNYYQHTPNANLQSLEQALHQHLNGESGTFYTTQSCPELSKHFSSLGAMGITATCGGFYAPQGRELRVPLRYPQFVDKLSAFVWNKFPIINLEMETAALYGLGGLLGHRYLSVSVVLSNRATGTFAKEIKPHQDNLISKALSAIEGYMSK